LSLDVSAEVRRVVGLVLRRDLPPSAGLSREDDPNWDSLKHVEIILSVESATGVRFDEIELAELDSVGAISAAVERHLAS
jgi:acyl carrier protein